MVVKVLAVMRKNTLHYQFECGDREMMNDLFFIGFILFFTAAVIILLLLYKMISILLRKRNCGNNGMRVLRIFTEIAAIIIAVIGLRAGIWLYENPRINDPDYIRSTYSIVAYNTTDITIESIEVFAGDNKVLLETIYDISPKEYRKINISTQESELIDSIRPPYNVYIAGSNDINTELCVGYFGIRTGGFELVNIIYDENDKIVFEKADHSSKEYIKTLRLHRKDQDLLSWY